ncbi:MAG TPA: hypothetical protein VEP92_07900 [Gaiellaceae bacterium]|jgi:hypothetical protein|nr:hypothetical protein [Gaiellaceae bacterium]
MKRLTNIFGLALTAAVLSVGVASAASLGLTTGKLGAGSATVSGCTSSSLTATRNVDNSGNVTQINVLSVPQACAGEILAVTLENSSHTSLGNASAIVGTCTGGCTASVTGFGTVSAANVTAYALSLTE